MSNVINFPIPQNMPFRLKPTVDMEPVCAVARTVYRRPQESDVEFVTRIVRAYKQEGGK